VLDVPANISPLERLEAALSDTTGVYVNAGVDAATYYAQLAEGIRRNMHQPFPVSAVVMPPGFSGMNIGERISGQCVAHSEGYWLVYQPLQDIFYCFWGTDQSNLGARGVSGGPLYCWSA
jgi:hypothetical protein